MTWDPTQYLTFGSHRIRPRPDAVTAEGEVLRGIPSHEASRLGSSNTRGVRPKASAINA